MEERPTLAPTLVAVLFLKRALAQSSPLTLYCMNERLRSGDQTESDCVWVREHHKLHHLTQSAKTMLLKSLTQCYDFQNEARWSSQSRDLMICSLALDPRFKQLAVQLCGLSRGEDYVWMQQCATESSRVGMMKSHAQHQRDQKLAWSRDQKLAWSRESKRLADAGASGA